MYAVVLEAWVWIEFKVLRCLQQLPELVGGWIV